MRKMIWRRMAATAIVPLVATMAVGSASAAVPFDFEPGSVEFTQSGAGANVAGGHPDLRIGFRLQKDMSIGFSGRVPQAPRRATVDLPPGLVGDPQVADICPLDDAVSTEQAVGIGRCPRTAAVGVVRVDASYASGDMIFPQERRLWRVPAGDGEVVAFGTSILSIPIRMAVTVSPSGGYQVRTTADQLPQSAVVSGFSVTLWGVPADHQGAVVGPTAQCDGYLIPIMPGFDLKFCNDAMPPDSEFGNPDVRFGAPLPNAERRPFLTNPSVCGASLDAFIGLVPYGTVFGPIEARPNAGTISDCGEQPFDPAIDVTPKSKAAGQPSGYTVGIDVPQNMDADGVGTAHVKDVSVSLPEGVAISPPSANGLDACSDAQLDLNGDSDPACPSASKIGELTIETPVLEEPVQGSAYLGTQLSNDPMSGEMYRLFLVAKTSGVLVKLKGAIKADPVTGQLTATFENNPQMPFSRMELRLDDGNRASLANPRTCGTYTAKATLTSWAGHSSDISSSFAIDEGCPTGQFAPTMTAGTANALAGSFSPFSMSVNRTDADQDLSRLNLELPSGLLAALGSVPLCGEAEANAGSCAASTRIGSTSVLAGSGGEPLPLTGSVYVTGPYKGAPFGLSVVVPAKVGPFDLGDVVVRAALHVDANNAKATAVTEPFPTIVGGVPVRLRQVNVTLDRPGFTFNATSCAQQQVIGGFWSTGGATATVGASYQAQGCDQLRLQPRLALQWFGKTQMRKGKHPGVRAQLGDMLGQANLKQVKVTLPLTAALDPQNAKALCLPEQAQARNCPADSIVGKASASTPALHERVSGPVYFVKGIRYSETGRAIETLPKLWVPLSGQGVTVDLWADSNVDSKQRLVSTFMNVPDVPVRDFQLEINGGNNGILEATNDVCGASKTTTIEYSGHNGGVTQQRVAFTAPDCKPQVVEAKNSRNVTVGVRVGGIGAGTLTMTGKGIGKAVRKVVRSDNALVRAKFTSEARRQLRAGKAIRTRLTVRYQPTKGKAINIRKTVRIAAVKVKGKSKR
jgi:hypothetical protein